MFAIWLRIFFIFSEVCLPFPFFSSSLISLYSFLPSQEVDDDDCMRSSSHLIASRYTSVYFLYVFAFVLMSVCQLLLLLLLQFLISSLSVYFLSFLPYFRPLLSQETEGEESLVVKK